MNMQILAKVLQDAGVGTMGQDIFVHRMDAECKRGILLRLPIAGIASSPELPGYHKSEDIQAIVRAQTQADGDALAKAVSAALTIYNRIFNDDQGNFALQIKQMYPAKLPIVYPRSDGYGIEWSLNFCAAYVQA